MNLNGFSFSKLQFFRRTFCQQGSENQSKQVGTIHSGSVVHLLCSAPKVWELAGQKMGKVLVVAADSTEREGRALAIELAGYSCATAASLREAVSLLRRDSFDLVVTDYALQGIEPGQIVKSLKDACPWVVVMVFYHPDDANAAPVADVCVAIPCSPKKFQESIRRALSEKSSRILPRSAFGKKPAGTRSERTERAQAAAASSLRSRL